MATDNPLSRLTVGVALKAREGYTSLEIKIAYHKRITPQTGELRIEGRIASRGARVGSAEGRITDAKGELLASGTTTCLIFAVKGDSQ